jgi:hypothetical protein
MKTVDFINFMDFTSQKRVRGIRENQCSFVINEKTNNFYFRFKGYEYTHLKVGHLNNKICFVLNKENGVKGQLHSHSETIAFNSKEMVLTIVKILKPDFDKKLCKGLISFELIEKDINNVVFIFKSVEIY